MREVYLDFGDGFVDVSHLVKYETLKYSQRAYNDSYRYAQNDCSFTLIYDELIFNQLYLGEAKVKIIKDSIPVFLGHTTPNKTKKYNGIVNISTYRIDAIDDLDYMEVEVGDIVYEDCKVLDPLNPTQSIIHKLANIAGWDNNRINSSVTIDTVIERFAPTSPEDLVLEVLNTLLYEYGYVLSLDANGNIEFHKWVFPSDTSYSVEFTEDNILLEIERKDSIKKYDSIKTYYYDIGFAEKVMLYRDSNCSYNADGTFKGVSVLNNTYYPFEANVIDETTGTNTIVEQEYTDESIRYFTNKAIKENLDYNYKAFSSDFSSMIATENHFLDSRYNSPMTVTHSFGNKKCQLLYHNTSGSSKDIWYSNVFGDVWYKSTERTCTIDIKDEVKDVYEYRSKYVFDKEVADRFTKALAALYKIGKVYYSFPSEADYAVGAVCRLVLKDTNVLAQIVEKTWNEDKEYWEYQIIQTSFEPLNITGTTTSVKVNVIPAGSFDFTTSSGQIIIPYTDNVPSFTNAIIELDVKRMGVSYLDDWTINAATTNCAGSFTSKGVYKISSVSSTAASITFTATNSFWGTLEKTVYISRASDEVGRPDTITGLTAVALQDGIYITWNTLGEGLKNTIKKIIVEINKGDGSGWVSFDATGIETTYSFYRPTDGYPEKEDFNSWRIRAKAVNIYNKESIEYGGGIAGVIVGTSHYLTWQPAIPTLIVNASNRSAASSWNSQKDFVYGNVVFHIQIAKLYQTNNSETVTDFSKEPSWSSPQTNSSFIRQFSSNFQTELENKTITEGYKYRYGDLTKAYKTSESYKEIRGNSFSQQLPLDQAVVEVVRQDDSGAEEIYLATVAENTTYRYRVRAVNLESEKMSEWSGLNQQGDEFTCTATSAIDAVQNAFNTANYIDGSITAKKIFTESLAAISANLGIITDGALQGSENVYLALSNIGGRKMGDFKFSNGTGDYIRGYTAADNKYYIEFKASKFEITAIGTVVKGSFYVSPENTVVNELGIPEDYYFRVDKDTGAVDVKGGFTAKTGSFSETLSAKTATIADSLTVDGIIKGNYVEINSSSGTSLYYKVGSIFGFSGALLVNVSAGETILITSNRSGETKLVQATRVAGLPNKLQQVWYDFKDSNIDVYIKAAPYSHRISVSSIYGLSSYDLKQVEFLPVEAKEAPIREPVFQNGDATIKDLTVGGKVKGNVDGNVKGNVTGDFVDSNRGSFSTLVAGNILKIGPRRNEASASRTSAWWFSFFEPHLSTGLSMRISGIARVLVFGYYMEFILTSVYRTSSTSMIVYGFRLTEPPSSASFTVEKNLNTTITSHHVIDL